jgi:hypothetical protein
MPVKATMGHKKKIAAGEGALLLFGQPRMPGLEVEAGT